MSYTYLIATDADVYDQFRAILGVTAEEYTDAEIDMLPILPAAELSVTRQITNYTSVLTNVNLVYDLQLAVLYTAVVNALPSLKFKMLQIETDNKTTAQRFKAAIETSPEFAQKAAQYISYILLVTQGSSVTKELFEISPPAINVISGDSL